MTIANLQSSLAQDPVMLMKFLDANRETLWSRHEIAWEARIKAIKEGIAQGEVRLRVAREMEADQQLLKRKEEAINQTIMALKREREEIVSSGDRLEAAKKALEYLAQKLQKSFDRLREDCALDEWLKQQRQDQAAAQLAMNRAKLELDITVAWFRNQLCAQHAMIAARHEVAKLEDRPAALLTEEQQRERAQMEVARTLVDRKE